METHKLHSTFGLKGLPSFRFYFCFLNDIKHLLLTGNKRNSYEAHLLSFFLRSHGAAPSMGSASVCGGMPHPCTRALPATVVPHRARLLSRSPKFSLFFSSLCNCVYFMTSIPYGCQSYLLLSTFWSLTLLKIHCSNKIKIAITFFWILFSSSIVYHLSSFMYPGKAS